MRFKKKTLTLAAIIMAGIAFALSAPVAAQANTGSISGGTPQCNVNYYYATARVNSYAHNIVEFRPSDWGCGDTLTLGLRSSQAASSSFAKASWSTEVTKEFATSTGSTSLAAGTFYITAAVSGTCGAYCPSTQTFSGTLNWNLSAQ